MMTGGGGAGGGATMTGGGGSSAGGGTIIVGGGSTGTGLSSGDGGDGFGFGIGGTTTRGFASFFLGCFATARSLASRSATAVQGRDNSLRWATMHLPAAARSTPFSVMR